MSVPETRIPDLGLMIDGFWVTYPVQFSCLLEVRKFFVFSLAQIGKLPETAEAIDVSLEKTQEEGSPSISFATIVAHSSESHSSSSFIL